MACNSPITVTISGITTICAGTTNTLTANGATTYTWNTGATTASVTPSSSASANYTVIGITGGCLDTATVTVTVLPNPPTPNICMVSTDSFFVNNIIYWDRTLYQHVDSFIVYRLSAGVYLQIGATSNDSNQLTDLKRNIGGPNGGDPNISSWYYKLAIKDTCGNISPMSPYHETVNFQQSNQNLIWNAYTIESPQTNPVNNYEVWRDSLGIGDWHIFVNTSGLSTTDPSYASYPNANYRTDATPFSCTSNEARLVNPNSPFAAKVRSHSNVNNNRNAGIKQFANTNEQVTIYPNPNNGLFNLSISRVPSGSFDNEKTNSIEVCNTVGACVHRQIATSPNCQIDLSGLNEGVYQLSIQNSDFRITKRVVIVK
jgi:hypothetical protein